jgi:hypothetical protein
MLGELPFNHVTSSDDNDEVALSPDLEYFSSTYLGL